MRGGTEPTLDEMTKGQNQFKEAGKGSSSRWNSMSKGPETRHSLGSADSSSQTLPELHRASDPCGVGGLDQGET